MSICREYLATQVSDFLHCFLLVDKKADSACPLQILLSPTFVQHGLRNYWFQI